MILNMACKASSILYVLYNITQNIKRKIEPSTVCYRSCKVFCSCHTSQMPLNYYIFFFISLHTWPSRFIYKICTSNTFFFTHSLALYYRNYIIFYLHVSSKMNTIHTHIWFLIIKLINTYVEECEINNFLLIPTLFLHIFV